VKATTATDKPHHNQPSVENVRLVEDSKSRATAPGFDMRYGWIPAIALLVVLYALVTLFFD
jgi:hypothetical protein